MLKCGIMGRVTCDSRMTAYGNCSRCKMHSVLALRSLQTCRAYHVVFIRVALELGAYLGAYNAFHLFLGLIVHSFCFAYFYLHFMAQHLFAYMNHNEACPVAESAP